MAVTLPTPGQEDWDTPLNAAIQDVDTRVTALEQAPPGVTDHGLLTGLGDDDHTQYWNNARGNTKLAAYQLSSQKGQPSGYAGLDSSGKVPAAQLPASSGGGGSIDADLSGSWFAGRKWYSLGTSITIDGSYANRIATLSGMSLTNLGVGGASLSTASNGNIWAQLTTNIGTDAEVVTMETINDFRLNVPLGTYADGENQGASYYGALRAAANWILTNRPAVRVFWFTAYGDAMNAGYPNGKTTNSDGKHYYEYNDAMRMVGHAYGIPVIDVGGESGINYYTCQFYTTDMIHMNALGGQRYAEYAWSRLRRMGWLTSRPTAPGAATNVPVTGVSITQGNDFDLAPGDTLQLFVDIAPSNASNKGVNWVSNNTNVVTVSPDGKVTAVANGATTVTATTQDGGFTDTANINVSIAAVASVDVSPPTATIVPTGTQQLTATITPSNAGNKNVTWSSSATGVATVNSSGLVTGVANGSATITATTQDGGKTSTCAITVNSTVPVTGVDLAPPSATVVPGNTVQLTATVSPSNASNKVVAFQSSDTGKATVNTGGLVTAVAAGSATISVTTQDGSFTDTSAITVPASEWSLSPQTVFRGFLLQGLTSSGSDPSWTGVSGNYGAIIINTAGHNAIEWTVQDGNGGCWIIPGFQASAGGYAGMGDMIQGPIAYCGTVDATGAITMNASPDPVPAFADSGYGTGKVYRMGRSGTRVVLYRVDAGNTLVKLWDGDLATNFSASPNKYAVADMGILAGGGPYSKPISCKTGTWTPP